MSAAADEFSFLYSCRNVLPEKIIVDQLVKNIPSSYGPRNFFTVFTRACPYLEPEPYNV
jgi:hypothetical protein